MRMNAIETPTFEARAKPFTQSAVIEAATVRPDLDHEALGPAIDRQPDLKFGMADSHLATHTLLAQVRLDHLRDGKLLVAHERFQFGLARRASGVGQMFP